MDDDYEIGWWRHPRHRREVLKAHSNSYQRAMARGLRKQAIGDGLVIGLVALVTLMFLILAFAFIVR